MERKVVTITIVILLVLIGTIAIMYYIKGNQKPFYVGVTYCGSSSEEAKELIDKVKDYTNLFILQSGTLTNTADVNEIGDYAIASKIYFAVFNSRTIQYNMGTNDTLAYYEDSTYFGNVINEWANTAKERWGKYFIGIYYNDEPGGNMLDMPVVLEHIVYRIDGVSVMSSTLMKATTGTITKFDYENGTQYMYYPDGLMVMGAPNRSVMYYPNGTLEAREFNVENGIDYVYTSENITRCPSSIQSYEEVLKQNPIRNYDEYAKTFVNMNKKDFESIDKRQLNKENILIFTADYGLYWWDYKSGYDFALAELGWNNTVAQEIALVRGAANLQGKNWGTCITWKYTHPPYLTNGEEMYQQMKTSYQTGAQYVLIFNYSEDPENANTLQEEHFQALERFWNDVVQNPKIIHGNIKAEASLVLPQNYGWGMRNPQDRIWGIWPTDDNSQQIWNQLQNKLDKHELKLDIIFEDPNYPVAGKYPNIYYWNQE